MKHGIRASNPFCTRYVSPGAIPYYFRPETNAAMLVERLRRNHWWGEIVGPHGSGKSTLVAALVPELHRAGKHPVLFALHDGARSLPADATEAIYASREGLLVIDGYEQLGYGSRYWLKRRCALRGIGLLVTSHASVGLPELYRTDLRIEQARQVVAFLLRAGQSEVIEGDVDSVLAAHAGNLREALFALYDLHEQRKGGMATVSLNRLGSP